MFRAFGPGLLESSDLKTLLSTANLHVQLAQYISIVRDWSSVAWRDGSAVKGVARNQKIQERRGVVLKPCIYSDFPCVAVRLDV